jgi:hypothetical protein
MIVFLTVAAAAFLTWWIYSGTHREPKLTEKDTVVLTDFDNKTGDAVFDETLKQALAVELEQSPFLNIVSDRRISATLHDGPFRKRAHYDGHRPGALRAYG